MKKLWIAGLTSAMILVGSMNLFSNPGAPIYEPVIESCVTQLWPYQDGYPFVLACLPGGNSTCSRGFCVGNIR